MKLVLRLYAIAHAFMALLFAGAGLMLVVSAARAGWMASIGQWDYAATESMVEAVGVLAARVGQSLVHLSHQQTDAFVAVRFSFFSVQLLCFVLLIVMVARQASIS